MAKFSNTSALSTNANATVGVSSNGAIWGNITGTITDQADLVSSLSSLQSEYNSLINAESNSRAYEDAQLLQDINNERSERKLADENILSKITWSQIKEPFYKDEANDKLSNGSLEHHFDKYNKDVDLTLGTFILNAPDHWYHKWNSEGQYWEWDYNVENSEGVTEAGLVVCAQYWALVEE